MLGLVVLYLGFFGFVASALFLIFRGFTKEGKPLFPKALYGFFAVGFFFLLFIAGLILL